MNQKFINLDVEQSNPYLDPARREAWQQGFESFIDDNLKIASVENPYERLGYGDLAAAWAEGRQFFLNRTVQPTNFSWSTGNIPMCSGLIFPLGT